MLKVVFFNKKSPLNLKMWSPNCEKIITHACKVCCFSEGVKCSLWYLCAFIYGKGFYSLERPSDTWKPWPVVSLDKPPPLLKKNTKHKNISEGKAPTHSLSYQSLPDASPQHHPTHSLKVHHNMEPSQWGGRGWDTVKKGEEEEEEKKKRCIAWKHSEGKVDHRAEEGRLEQRERGRGKSSVKDPSLPLLLLCPKRLKTKERGEMTSDVFWQCDLLPWKRRKKVVYDGSHVPFVATVKMMQITCE